MIPPQSLTSRSDEPDTGYHRTDPDDFHSIDFPSSVFILRSRRLHSTMRLGAPRLSDAPPLINDDHPPRYVVNERALALVVTKCRECSPLYRIQSLAKSFGSNRISSHEQFFPFGNARASYEDGSREYSSHSTQWQPEHHRSTTLDPRVILGLNVLNCEHRKDNYENRSNRW